MNNSIIKKSKRNSSIEVMKIIAMILIVISHSVPIYGDQNSIANMHLGAPTTNMTNLVLVLFRYCGHIGNTMFVVCSSYFLLDSTRSKKEKIMHIVLDTLVISLIHLSIAKILNFNISKDEFDRQIHPMAYGTYWFVSCYLILYIIHPYLNKIINSISKQNLFRINIVLLFFYGIVQYYITDAYYYSGVIGFITIYLCTAFVKKYMKAFSKNVRLNMIIAISALVSHILSILFINVYGLATKLNDNDALFFWNSELNILTLIWGICIFNVFNSKKFYNKIINTISSLTLVFYMIHENSLFSNKLRPEFYEYVFSISNYRIVWVLIQVVAICVLGVIISLIYKYTLQKIVYKIGELLLECLRKIYLKIERKILKKI